MFAQNEMQVGGITEFLKNAIQPLKLIQNKKLAVAPAQEKKKHLTNVKTANSQMSAQVSVVPGEVLTVQHKLKKTDKRCPNKIKTNLKSTNGTC